MDRSIFAVFVVAICGAAALAGCSGTKPFIREGNTEKVEVVYSTDVDVTLPLARAHCAQFERVPQFVDAGANIAQYDCVRP